MRIARFALMIGLAAACCLPSALAQANFPFQLRAQQDSNVFTFANNSTLSLGTDGVGTPASVRITIVYQGRTRVTLPSAPQLLGSSAFALTPIGAVPLTLQPNELVEFTVTYTPQSSALARAQLSIPFAEAPAPTDPAVPITGAIAFGLAGTAPEVAVSYAFPTNSNVVALAEGGRIPFPATLVNGVSSASVILSNRGAGPATINSILVTGENFQVLGLPLLPGNLPSAGTFTFVIRYSPKLVGAHTGSLRVDIGGKVFSAIIEGSATNSTWSYEVVQNGVATPIQPNQDIAFAETAVGERTSVTVEVRNVGNAEGTIGVVSLSGAGFGLADLPFLPTTVAPDGLTSFTVIFAPTQPGRVVARLRIGNDLFSLAGNGIGSRLTFKYSTGVADIPVLPGAQVLFSPEQVGKTTSVTFTMRNEGTSAATIATIGLGDSREVFRLESLPSLPLLLQPDESASFVVTFTPALTGQSSAALLVHSFSFSVSGFGTAPPPLPAFRFSGATGTTVQPLDQPAIRLALDTPYPLALRGVLTITPESDLFAPDPAVQFITGGRQVSFTIPANSVQAVFGASSESARFQTGTVSTTLSFSPTFSTTAGLDLTPTNVSPYRVTVPPLAPTLLTLQVASRSADALVLVVNGFATNRALTKLDFSFTGTSDVNLSGSQVSVSVQTESANWFRNPASQSFGGQFSITMPFTFRSETAGTVLLDKIQSVAVTATNGLGTSNSVSTTIR